MRNNKWIGIVLMACFLFPAVLQVNAQGQGMLATFNSYYGLYYKKSSGYKKILHYLSYNRNSCLKYYYDPEDTTQALFKSVSVIKYISRDSTLKHKRFESNAITMFDKKGQELFTENKDSTGVQDSSRYFYDKKDREIRNYTYERDDSGRIRKTKEEISVYNANGDIVLDSTYNNYGERYSEMDGPANSYIHTSRYTYNDQGDNVETISISGFDTSITHSKFVMHKRVYVNYNGKNSKSETYMNYNMVGNLTGYRSITKSYNDTSVVTTEFNDTGRMVKYMKYINGKPESIDTIHFNENGTSTEVDDKITQSYSPTVCPNDERMVTICDKQGNVLSEVSTEMKAGKPFTKIIKHSYTFSKGNIVLDSCKTIEQGYLYASTNTNIDRYVYDAHGNEIETDAEGGGQYSKNGSETWKYNEHNKMLVHNEYNSCNTDIPEKSTMNIYYPGGTKIIECIENEGKYGSKTHTYYTEDSKIQEELKNSYGTYSMTLYEYKK